jgi:CHAT domain-containing protein
LRFNNDKLLRSYLLGTLPQQRAEQLEERLLKDAEIVERLSLIEDELIEDYARDALDAGERQQFEKYFLSNPKRRRKLMLVRGLRKYTMDIGHVSPANRAPARRWFFPFFSPPWAAAAAVLLVALGGFFLWRLYFSRNDVDKGLIALNEAYKTKRPVEARVTGFDYAPYSPTRGPNDVNSRELDRSAALLQNAVNEEYSPEALHALGRFHLFKREFDKAAGEFEEALKAKPGDATIQSDLGAALFEKGKLERAADQSGRSETTLARSLEHLNRALELNDSLLDARFNRALLYEEMRLTPQALEDWNKYLTLDANSRWAEEARRKIEDLKKRSEKVSQRNNDLLVQFFDARAGGNREKMWQFFSNAHLRTGNAITNKLVDNYLGAVTASVPSPAAGQALDTLSELGKLSSDKSGDRFTADIAQVYRSATTSQQKSLVQARKDVAAAYDLFNQSKHDLAISLFDRAKSVFSAEGDHPEALLASFWLSHCHLQRGNNTHISLSIAEQADRQCEARGYKWLRSLMQVGLANGRRKTTEYSQAVSLGWASYETSKQIADRNGEIRSLNVLADLYRILGNYRRALYLAQQGRDLGSEILADPSQVVGFHAVSARSLMLLGHYPAALEYQKQTVTLAEAMNSPLARSRYRVQMGMVLEKLKKYDEAIRNIRLGIEAGQSVSDGTSRKEMSTYAQVYLARVYRELGNFNEALVALTEAENFCNPVDEQPWLLHDVKKEQLLTRIAQGDVAAAKEDLARVLSDYEDQRQRIVEESNRNSFFDQEQNIYDVAIDFAYAHSSAKDAFDYSERSRGRSLLDSSTKDWQEADNAGVPEPRFLSALKPASLDQLQKDLPEGAQLLQFAVLKDKLLVWYLTRDRFETTPVNVTSDELRAKVDRLLNLVASPANDNERQRQRVSSDLYDLLIAPVAQFLDPQKQLVVVPDKILNLLPFNVLLSSSSKYLVEDFALSYASSANVFVRDTALATEKQAAATDDEKFLGVGNPTFDPKAFPDLDDLPSAAREIEEIGQFYRPEEVRLLRRDEATKSSVLSEMRTADVVHLATHYLPDANSPMRGRLVLVSESREPDPAHGADGVLQAYEIYRLKPLHARLAILAGCQTGVEDYVNGEGPIGLARPFNAAGVPLVVASLWPVDSRATTELMIQFHRLRRQKHSSAEALRAAQVQMLRNGNPDHRSPYYWGSFSLTGGYSNY